MAAALDADASIALSEASSAAASYDGSLYYQTRSSSPAFTYNVLRRISDDRALYVVRVPEACYPASSDAAAPFVFQFLGDDATTRWIGYFAPTSGTFVVPDGPSSINGPQDSWFSWEAGVGALGVNGAVNLLTGGHGQAQLVYQASAYSTQARARAGLVTWVDWGTAPTTVRSWTKQGGVAALFQAPEDVAGIALGEEVIAFLGVTGANAVTGGYDTARIYWSPFASTASGIQIHAGADVTGQVGGRIQAMSTAGDYIAVRRQAGYAASQSITGIVVTQISTGKIWILKPRPNMYMTVAGMSSTELLAFESDYAYSQQNGYLFQRWLRLDLSKLDQLVTTLPSGV
jgi:hypothetical protein